MKRIFSALSALALAVLILMSGTAPALANSAQTHWYGVTLTGAQVQDKDCPLVVDHEDLTFHIAEFPASHYRSQQEFLAYSGSVTAEYTFRNPANYTVTATLSFPFGDFPSYGFDSGDADTAKYGVTVNGSPVPTVLRHTYSPQFSVNDLALMRDDYMEDNFFSPDLPVTKVTYTVSDVDTQEYSAASAGFDYVPHPESTRFLLPNMCGSSFGDGEESIHTWLEQDGRFDLYILGEVPDPLPQWKCYENGAMETEIPGKLTPTVSQSLTFRDLVFMGYDPDSRVSETDWYNAVTAYLKWNTVGEAVLDCTANLQLMRWYQYEITLGPGEALKNAVTAPLYPDIDTSYEPPVYTYEYLLSPAQTWKEFGDVDIRIEAPFFMAENKDTLKGFQRGESGYSLHLDGLPDEELVFSLSEDEHPSRANYQLENFTHALPFILSIFLPIAALILVAILITRCIYRRKNRL